MQEMQETQFQPLGWDDPPEKGMATHSDILAWRIPWTQQPGHATAYGVPESWTQLKQLIMHKCTFKDYLTEV